MPESDKPRTPTPRLLKPAPPRPGQVVHSPRLKSEVHFTLPGSIPVVGECSCARVDFIRSTEPSLTLNSSEIVQIRTAAVSQPFLDPAAMQRP